MRLLTRSDFDGLACGVLLKHLGVIDSWKFIHPKDMQDGLVEVTENDVLANVPYVDGCGMWFDHHASEISRVPIEVQFKGSFRVAPSAARVIYDYYGGEKAMPQFAELIVGVDKVDSGQLGTAEILKPKGWVLLGFIMDPRTGLGRFRDFTIPNYKLMENLIDACATMGIDEILALSDVAERVKMYQEQVELFAQMVLKHTRIVGNVICTDLRGVSPIYTGNRFMVYAMFPEQNVSLWVVDGKLGQNVSIATGYSIVKRTCIADIGKLMLSFGGGGHKMVGTCQVPTESADGAIEKIIEALRGK
ncbi:MAG: exopolyphosphatase [Firmicutes bacterium]|nr:exopolyphosphatase [Bacillota bacterium]